MRRRTRFGFALAIFAGVMTGIVLDPILGGWSILAGVAAGSAVDVAIRLLDQRRAHDAAAAAHGEERRP